MGNIAPTGGTSKVRKIVVPVEEEFLLASNGEDGGYLDPSLPTLHTAQGQTTR